MVIMVIIRLLRKNDNYKLQQFVEGISKENYFLWNPPSINNMYNWHFSKKIIMIIAEIENQFVGIACLLPHPDYPDFPSLNIVVADNMHRKGIGKRLMIALQNLAEKNKYKGLYCGCLKRNPAIAFYRSMGFIIIGEKITHDEEAWELKWFVKK